MTILEWLDFAKRSAGFEGPTTVPPATWAAMARDLEAVVASSLHGRAGEISTPLEGWKLVPIEPTEAMLVAFHTAVEESVFDDPLGFYGEGYTAMLSASPSLGEQGEVGRDKGLGASSALALDDQCQAETEKLTDTFNEYGTPVTMFRCGGCGNTFTVCPAVPDDALDQWPGCLGEGCSTYDPARDADKLFDEGKVHRVGDRSAISAVDGAPPLPNPPSAEERS